mmetsp:Transcript_55358/g.157299  ORF Transcript_55358/g.157299 Transcript_55358/m.157299 type:complete len:495 (-) Transcript_55358:75-1559(-)
MQSASRELAMNNVADLESSADSDTCSDTDLESLPRSCIRRRRCCILVAVVAVVSVVATLVLTPLIGKYFASRGIRNAQVYFSSIDVGTISEGGVMKPRIVGRVSKPSPLDATLRASRMAVRAPQPGGRPPALLGHVSLPDLQVVGDRDLDLNLTADFELESPDAFAGAGKRFVEASSLVWFIEAEVDVSCTLLGFIPLNLKGIPFNRSISLQGMGSFSQAANPITMNEITSAYGLPGFLTLSASINLYNPSYIAGIVASKMHFNITHLSKPFGVATLDGIQFRPGQNVVPLSFVLQNTWENRLTVQAFISAYIRAEHVLPVTMHGTPVSSTIPFLSSMMNGLNMSFNFRPPKTQFIQGIEASVGVTGISAVANILNPLPQSIVMGDLDLSIREDTVKGAAVFDLDTAQSTTHIPGQELKPGLASALHMKLSLFSAHLTDFDLLKRLIEDAQSGEVVVGVTGPVEITISPGFSLTVNYTADNIAASIRCPLICPA